MGGVVARCVIMLKNYKNTVSMIFTLSSPHVEPPVPLNYGIKNLYSNLNKFWKNSTSIISQNISLVSIAGGTRDSLLESRLTHLNNLMSSDFAFHVYSTSMPGCWASADHEGMVW